MQIKCLNCKTYELSKKEIEILLTLPINTGISICPRCDREASLFFRGKKIQTDRDVQDMKWELE